MLWKEKSEWGRSCVIWCVAFRLRLQGWPTCSIRISLFVCWHTLLNSAIPYMGKIVTTCVLRTSAVLLSTTTWTSRAKKDAAQQCCSNAILVSPSQFKTREWGRFASPPPAFAKARRQTLKCASDRAKVWQLGCLWVRRCSDERVCQEKSRGGDGKEV